jgi:transcriptional regulator with XRE-family HTH domain
VARTKRSPVSVQDRKVIGGLLRDIRRSAGYRSVESASATKGCPASRQTIYAYERGGLVPSLAQFLELVEFFVLDAPMPDAAGAKSRADLRAHGVSAVTRALTLPAYHVTEAMDLVARMQPDRGGKA